MTLKVLPPISADWKMPIPTEQQLDRIEALWDMYCPPAFRGLLDADKTPNSKFTFDKQLRQYRIRKTGKLIPRRMLNDAFIEFSRKRAGK